ncbi:MAG: hypothetical protein RR752_05180, partial [Mucinivorans sp.]
MKIRHLTLVTLLALTLALSYSCSLTYKMQRKQYHAQLQHTPKKVQNKIQMERDSILDAQLSRDSINDNVTTIRNGLLFGNSKSSWVEDEDGAMVSVNIDRVSVVGKARTLAERDGKVEIDFMIIFPKELQGESQNILIKPFLIRGDERIALNELQIRGGLFSKLQDRNYWRYYKFRNQVMARTGGEIQDQDSIKLQRAFERFIDHPYLTQARFDSITKGSETVTYLYREKVKTEQDTKKLMITLAGQIQALDGSQYFMPPSDTITFYISSMLSFVEQRERYIKKVIEKYASVEDKAFLNFQVGKTNLIDTLGDNKAELNKIGLLMKEILIQNEYHVDNITLTAGSSPEGNEQSNFWLSRGRAESIKHYLTTRFDYPEMDTLLKVRWVGEDWGELINRIKADETIDAQRAILDILGNETLTPDAREGKVRERFPKQYKYMLNNIYPKLRSVKFTYALRRVGMIK